MMPPTPMHSTMALRAWWKYAPTLGAFRKDDARLEESVFHEGGVRNRLRGLPDGDPKAPGCTPQSTGTHLRIHRPNRGRSAHLQRHAEEKIPRRKSNPSGSRGPHHGLWLAEKNKGPMDAQRQP